MQMHPKLAHLSAEKIIDLLKKYDDPSIPLKKIISEFLFQTTPSALNGLLPPFSRLFSRASATSQQYKAFGNGNRLASSRTHQGRPWLVSQLKGAILHNFPQC